MRYTPRAGIHAPTSHLDSGKLPCGRARGQGGSQQAEQRVEVPGRVDVVQLQGEQQVGGQEAQDHVGALGRVVLQVVVQGLGGRGGAGVAGCRVRGEGCRVRGVRGWGGSSGCGSPGPGGGSVRVRGLWGGR